MNERQSLRGFLASVEVIPPLIVTFQFNPETIKDNKKVNYKIRADFIVTKGGKKFVIEVKSGEKAPDPKTPATRRQLLEYAHAYQADGVLLADMTDVVLREIEFDINRTRYSWFDKLKAAILFTIIGAIVGFVIAS